MESEAIISRLVVARFCRCAVTNYRKTPTVQGGHSAVGMGGTGCLELQ